jgi:flagellar motility protein MotE (MotC chaperone)
MSRSPRLLPLIAVAISGVLAMKAISTVRGAPAFLKEAMARAETPAPGEAVKANAQRLKATAASGQPASSSPAAPPGLFDPSSAPPAALVKASAPAVCAPSAAELAKEAGLSPAELRVLQSLQARRGQLDQREQAIQTELALLSAAEAKVDAKLKSLQDLKTQVQGLMGQADEKQQAEIDRLVKVYESMKPRDAAAVMAQLDDKVRIPVAAKMKERALAAILAQMPPAEAKKLTEKLAGRFTPPESITQAAIDAPAQAPAAAAAPKARKPAKQGA